MKTYDMIAIGTGSVMNFMENILQMDPEVEVAVIDKDDPGGICLTRGCIPTKMLVYPAEMVRMLASARHVGVEVDIKHVDFQGIMKRMTSKVKNEVDQIREALSQSPNIDYYQDVAEFTGPYELRVGGKNIKSDRIFLCTGSRPLIPEIKGLNGVSYHTSDTILKMREVPSRIAILGGGYIAAEYGHFFSAMGSEVVIIGRNAQFLPQEEPEVSRLAKHEMSKHMRILTDHEVIGVTESASGKKEIVVKDRKEEKEIRISSDELLVAAGRASNSDILHPERSGIETDKKGWIKVNEYLETSAPNIWALGDATGNHLFKHVANYESKVVFYNAFLKEKMKVRYHAVPHAVFTHPEIAAVGLKESDAIRRYGESDVLIGFRRYQDTAKGDAMGVKDYFVKVVLQRESRKILGAHIIGPQASVLIQGVINLMYTPEQNIAPITAGMHIHPALSEAVQGAFFSLMPSAQYQRMMEQGQM
ncbi:MAG: dihydrolipoyl dehydrogenase [Desulfobacteraceae bacterium]|jgi:dihydrolipoamide dehydrogenase